MARGRRRIVRREWTTQDEKELKRHSKKKTPVTTISKALKRTVGALRQKALKNKKAKTRDRDILLLID